MGSETKSAVIDKRARNQHSREVNLNNQNTSTSMKPMEQQGAAEAMSRGIASTIAGF